MDRRRASVVINEIALQDDNKRFQQNQERKKNHQTTKKEMKRKKKINKRKYKHEPEYAKKTNTKTFKWF